MLLNKLIVICIGIVLTGLVYAAIATFAARREHPQEGDRCRRSPRSPRPGAWPACFIGDRRPDARAEGGVPLPVPRRLRHHREGPHLTVERAGAGAAGADLAARRRARCQQALPLRRRHGGHLAVLLRRLERLLSRDGRAGRGARRQAPGGRSGKRRTGRPGPGAPLPDQSALPVQHAELALLAGHGRPTRGSREHDPEAVDLLPLQPVARSDGGRHAWPRRSSSSGSISTSRRCASRAG